MLEKLEKLMQSELTGEQEFVENEFQNASEIVVTFAVAIVIRAKSSFFESEGGTT